MAQRKLEIVIAGDARGMQRTLGQVQGSLGSFGSRFRTFAGGMAAGVASAFAVTKIASFASSLASLGTQMEVAGIKADTVFGDSADDVRKWADEVNESMGLSDEALTGLAANMGDLLKPMGFTADEAANMSTEMLDLSGALSAWSGGTKSAAEVAEIMSSALMGEREQLKGLGISISQAEIDARVMRDTTGELTDAQLAQAEAIATQQLILEKSTDAQAAWNDGSMDGIKAQNELKAAWEDAKVFLAERFLPILQRLFDYAKNVIDFAKVLKAAWDINGFQGVIDVLGRWFDTVLKPKLGEWVEGVGTWATETGLPLLKEGLVTLGEGFWDWLTGEDGAITWAGDKLGEAMTAIADWVESDGIQKIVDAVAPMVDGFWSWMTDEEDGAIAKIDTFMSDFLDGLNAWITGEGKSETESTGSKFGGSLATGLINGWLLFMEATIWKPFMWLVEAIPKMVTRIHQFLLSMGWRIGDAIVQGMKDAISEFDLLDAIRPHGPSVDLSPFDLSELTPWDRSGGRSAGRLGLRGAASGAPTINVYSMNPTAETGRMVAVALEEHRRSGGSVAGLF